MNQWKRIFCAALAVLMVICTAPVTAQAAKQEQYFNDVSETAWYATAVNYLAKEKIIGGREDGGFHPNDTITRAELIRLLAAVSKRDCETESYLLKNYKDVNQNGWYAPYLSWALQEKLVGGTGTNTFSPDAPIDREQLALILYRFHRHVMGYRFEQGDDSLFTDTAKISSWAKKAALACADGGLLSGFEDGTFRPKNRATRAEAAQILYNYLRTYFNSLKGISNKQLRYIMHGGGDIEGEYAVSNSLNAINESVRRGNYMIELDFSWTSDGKMVCAHEVADGTTHEEFMSQTLKGDLLPMDLDTVISFLRSHPEVHIVPDFKTDNVEGLRYIAENASDILDRFVPYVTHLSEYDEIHEMGFPNLILTTYQMTGGEKKEVSKNVRFAAEHDFVAIFVPYEFTGLCEQYLSTARKENVPLLLATVNSAITMETYVQKGADGFFTNSQTLKATRFQHWGF